MSYSTASYITKNRYSIYYFQIRIDKSFRNSNSSVKSLFRKSLRTRDRREALKLARWWFFILDNLWKRYFDSADSYAYGLKLLTKYHSVELSDWSEVQKFLDELEDEDSEILATTLQCEKEKKSNIDHAHSIEIESLQKQIELLREFFVSSGSNHIVDSGNDISLKKIITLWLEQKENTVSDSTLDSYRKNSVIFEKLLFEITSNDNLNLSDIGSELIRDFKSKIKNLPVHRNAIKFKNKSLLEMVDMDSQNISFKTFVGYLQSVRNLFQWSKRNGYVVNESLVGILEEKRSKKYSKQRVNFSAIQLKLIFESDFFIDGSFKYSSEYWVQLIAIFTGARLREIAQLRVSDIRKIDDNWVFDINETKDNLSILDITNKSLKSENSIRFIPVHRELIKLGFLNFVEFQKERDTKVLFDTEKQQNISGKYDALSKRLSNKRKVVGIVKNKDERLDFHSFRHVVRTKLTELKGSIRGLDEGLIDSIMGHTSKDRSVGYNTYNHADLTKLQKKVIDAISYDIDFTKIKRWDKCEFHRKKLRK